MKITKRGWLWVGAGVLVIGGAGSLIDRPPGSADNVVMPAAKQTPPAPHPTFRVIGGPDVFAMIVPSAMTAEAMALASKAQCGRREFCQVYAWADELHVPAAFPMSDRELASLIFNYRLNRSTGYEQLLWDCRRYPRRDRSECL
jgi:hypothetical protein